MSKRQVASTKKLDQNKPELVSQTGPDEAAPAAGSDFETVSWLALTGTLIGVYLTVVFPSLDPLATLPGQFP
jgi:hypothetical protein